MNETFFMNQYDPSFREPLNKALLDSIYADAELRKMFDNDALASQHRTHPKTMKPFTGDIAFFSALRSKETGMYLSGGSQWHSHPSGAWKMSADVAERMLPKFPDHEIVGLAVSTVVIEKEP